MNYVFLGTPQVAANVLSKLLEKKSLPCGDSFQCIAVVSQPPARSARGKGNIPSPVQQLAEKQNITFFCPDSAKDPDFVLQLKELCPDLCITAAYGQILSDDFLRIAKYGTLNIHPSLLPAYRGAAPVQRTLEAGESFTGVTVLQSVRQMDAGPIAWQAKYPIDNNIKADALLEKLFALGAEGLIETANRLCLGTLDFREQDIKSVSHAKKLCVEEAWLDFSQDAWILHNKVRAFCLWPGTKMKLKMANETMECKVITTRATQPEQENPRITQNPEQINNDFRKIVFSKEQDALLAYCDNGSKLEILELQLPGKKVTAAKNFWNGLKDKNIERV